MGVVELTSCLGASRREDSQTHLLRVECFDLDSKMARLRADDPPLGCTSVSAKPLVQMAGLRAAFVSMKQVNFGLLLSLLIVVDPVFWGQVFANSTGDHYILDKWTSNSTIHDAEFY